MVASVRVMTVAVMVKVHDGIVLASDSATTLPLNDGSAQVYNNADKIFNLHRGLPIAAMTWGLGAVGSASVSTVAKDLRRRLMGDDPEFADWALNPATYTVQEVAERLSALFHEGLVTVNQELQAAGLDRLPAQCLGMLVAGFSAQAKQSEAWLIFLDGLTNEPPVPTQAAKPDDVGWLAWGYPHALHRLFFGADNELAAGLEAVLPQEHHAPVRDVIQRQQKTPVVAAMPFADAIELARYCVEVVEGFAHFLPGPDIVGGPVEVAGINRHERFKWVSRKHYYSTDLNQGVSQ